MGTVGIITYHWSDNYGALLQTLALQEVLRQMGHEPFVIDYHNWARTLRASDPTRIIRRVVRLKLERFLGVNERIRRTEQFRAKYLSLTPAKYRDQDSLYQDPPILDAYVTGSDQVWNPANNGFDQAYFLTFAPRDSRKIAYAPSFGVSELPTRYWGDYRLWIGHLDHVSVREAEGARIVKDLLGATPEVVVDPTLLLEPTVWRKVVPQPVDIVRPYVLCYHVTRNRETQVWIADVAQQLAKLTGWDVISVGHSIRFSGRRVVRELLEAGPEEFIGLVDNCSAIVTDSFHGLAFSINYKKPFFLGVNPKFARNARLTHLIRLLGLEDRLWDSSRKLVVDLDLLKTDYRSVSEKLEAERAKSLHFLQKSLVGIG